jgi:N12 class adenine-specific DNA methylase
LRKDERLKTIYETIAPHITRSEIAWRDYLKFASKFFKYSFDNALLVYAQNPNVTMLAPTAVWNKVGRYVNKGATGIAVCEYENARLTIKHLFDVSQTNGRDVIATSWQLDEDMKKRIELRLSYGHNIKTSGFADCLRQISYEAVMENLDTYLQNFQNDFGNHLFEDLPHDGLEMQLQELISDSVSYFVGKRCGLTDEEMELGYGMATIAHFNTIPLIAKLGHTVTDISKGILIEIERNIKIIEKERRAENEQNRRELHRDRRSEYSQYPNLEQQRGRQATGEIRQDGNGVSQRTKSTAIYDFENGWHFDGDHALGTRESSGENRAHHTADVKVRSDAEHRGHHGENQTYEQPEISSRGNRSERTDLQSEISSEPYIPNVELSEKNESLTDGSFFMPENDPIGDYNIPDELQEMKGTDEPKIKEKLLKVLVVEHDKTPYITEIHNGYKELQKQVGGTFTTIEITEGIDAICADDVDFDSTSINRIVNGQPIFGTFLVARVNYNTGEYVSLTDADIDKYFKQFEAPLIEITNLLQEFEDVKIRQEEKASEPNFQEIGFYRMMPVGQVSLPTAKTAIQDNPIYSQIEDISKAHKVETIEAEPMQSKQMNLFDVTPKSLEEQLIEIVLLEGSVMQDGKKRIYDFAKTNPTGSAFSAFLKAEYGVGGHSVNKQGIGFENHNSTGIEFDWADENGEKHKTNITWLRAAIVIRKLIDEGRYLDLQEVNIDQDEKFNSLKNELEEVKAELIEIEKKWESGAIFSYKQSEYWQDLEDLKDELEKELAEIEQYHTPDEKDSEEKESKPQEQTAKDIPLSVEAKSGQSRHTKLNFRYSEDYNLYPNGAKTKYKNNIEAIKLLKRIESEKRLANPEEQIILARYVGWGGLANAFSDTASGWENEYQELKVLLDEKEYEDARNSTITAYYTEPELIKRIYNAIEKFGFKGGRDRKILDPAMGTGNFFSVLPDAIADTPLYGVEIDSITGRIAKQLYQKANVYVQGYETTNFEDNSFDVILGNIPFNNIKLYDKRYADEDFLVHDYFIAKSLDLVKPGGIIGFITSKGTMDKRDTAVREYIAQRADLVGAIRLPNNAFKALAGTEVTADILFFQKLDRPRKVDNYSLPDWVFTNTRKTDYINLNQYFHEHPDMVLGEMRHSRNMYGNEEGTACIAPEGQDLYAELDKAINKLHATFTAEADKPIEAAEEESVNEVTELDAPKGTKNYTYVVLDEKIYYCEHNKLIPQDYTGKRAERIKALCEIRGALLNVIAVQTRDYKPDELQKAQKKLNSVYDRFVDRCGFINDKSNIAVFSDDDQFPLLRSIEDQSEDKQSWVKAPIFYKATIKLYRLPDRAETAKEALEISLNVKMKIDLPYMANLTGKTADELIDELGDRIYLNPQKYYGNYYEGWELNEEYLSGQVKDKLLYAKIKAEEYPDLFTRNVEALEAVQPPRLLPGDIDFRIGSPWIPIEYYRQFMHETFGTPYYLRDVIDIDYMEYTTQWRVLNKTRDASSVKVNKTYGTSRVNAYQIFEDCLNLQSTTVRDPVPYVDANGKDQVKYVVNANETMIARAKQNQIKETFGAWLFSDKDRAEVLLNIYNERFNTIRPRVYDGSHLIFPGMSDEVKLRPHQRNFAARVIYSGTGLAGHVVGAGKTAALIASGMYLKSIGAIKKPIYVVPNHLTEQWAKEFYRFFPQANILVTTKKDFDKANRNKFVSRIAMGDYDAIIIGHSQFERIPISKERQEKQLNEEINQLSYIIKKMRDEKGDNWSIKQMVIFQNNLKNRLTKLAAEEKKDDLLTFEQLGVDYMFVDEAHVYKNCFSYTKMRNVAGIGKSASQRATDMLLKCQYLQEINNGKGVVFATGTPISNSMSEMYVMQRYLQPQTLQKMGLNYFDSWAATFGEVVSSLEITPEGSGYRMRNRFAKFHNLPELMNMFQLVADIQTADMLNLPTPDIEGGKAAIIATEATPFQKMLMDTFVERADKIRSGEVDASTDNMLKLTNEAKLMSIDPRLIIEDAPNDPNSKLNIAIDKVFDIWQKTKEKRSTQIIFCDSGTPKPGQFNVYDEIKQCLIEKGVPEEQIAFVHDAKTDEQREALFEKVRMGEVRILLGSTSKLGTGTNVQDKLIAVHHLDCPWRPSDIEQRDGRILRQGNENPVVNIFRYVTKDTFDAYLWQIQEQKLKYISQVMTGKSISRSCEDMDETVLSAAEVKAIATSNPLLAEKMEVDNEVARLKLLKANWNNERIILERNIESHYPNMIAHCKEKIAALEKDIELKNQSVGQEFSMLVDGKTFDERVKAGERLIMMNKLHDISVNGEPLEVGAYRGFKLLLVRSAFDQLEVQIKGASTYRVELGDSELGSVTRIENAVEKIDSILAQTKQKLEDAIIQLAEAKKEVVKPFEFEERLAEYSARQAEINTKLEFKELRQQEEVIIDENGQESDSRYSSDDREPEHAIAERDI